MPQCWECSIGLTNECREGYATFIFRIKGYKAKGRTCLHHSCSCHRLIYFTSWNRVWKLHTHWTTQTQYFGTHFLGTYVWTHSPLSPSFSSSLSLSLSHTNRANGSHQQWVRGGGPLVMETVDVMSWKWEGEVRSHYVYFEIHCYRKPPEALAEPSSVPLGGNPAGARPSSWRRRSCHGLEDKRENKILEESERDVRWFPWNIPSVHNLACRHPWAICPNP